VQSLNPWSKQSRQEEYRLRILSAKYKKLVTFVIVLILFFFNQEAIVKSAPLSLVLLDFAGERDTDVVPQPWNIRLKEGKADVRIASDNGGNVLHITCRESSVSVERNASVDIIVSPYMSWTWKVLKVPTQGDVRKKGYNDQALQILVAFENRKILSYVWDSNAPEGTITDESVGWPVNLKIKVIVVKAGTTDVGKWITQTRNIYEDYKNIFHEEPLRLKGVRIQTNTQYTRDTAEGFVKSIMFSNVHSITAQKIS
jgi:hypothetical protein